MIYSKNSFHETYYRFRQNAALLRKMQKNMGGLGLLGAPFGYLVRFMFY